MPRRLVLGNASWSLSIVSSSTGFDVSVIPAASHQIPMVPWSHLWASPHWKRARCSMSISRRFWKSRFPPMMTVSRPSEFNRYRSGTFTSKVSPVGKTTWATHGSAPLVQHGEDLPQVPDGSSWRDRAWVAVSGFAVDDVVHFDSLSLWGWRLAYALPTPQVYHTCVIFCKCLPTFPEPNRRPCRSP